MLFMAEPGAGPAYLAIALTIAYAGYSIVILSQMGIGAGLTPDYHERSRVFAWWQVFNVAGLILVLVAPPLLALYMPVSADLTVQIMGVSIVATTPLTIAVALIAVRDTSRQMPGARQIRLRDYFGLFRLASVRYLLAAVMMTGLGLGVSAAAFIFFFTILKGISAEQIGLMLAGFFVVNIFAAPAWARIGNRIGKHRALALGGVGTAFYMLLVTFMPPGDFLYLGFAFLLGGFCACSADLLPRAMMADVADEDRLVAGSDRTGMLYALLQVTHKLGQALAIGIAYVLLDLIGFDAKAGTANNSDALLGILLIGSIIPGLLHLSGGVLAYFYPLTAERHAQIREQIEAQTHKVGDPRDIDLTILTEPGRAGAAIPAASAALAEEQAAATLKGD
jgi:Na+/melibiose symporter-like transporter